jgi:hypothetical protein
MGFEKSHIFGKVEIDIRATVAGSIVFQTETPNGQLLQRFSMPIAATNGRTVLRSRLPGTMQGHFVRSTGIPGPTGWWELYGVRIWSRELPTGQWQWFPLPVMDSPIEFERFDILADSTISSEDGGAVGFTEFKIPVEETPVEYSKFNPPVEETPLEFAQFSVPMQDTPVLFTPLQAPVEETPASFTKMPVPSIDAAIDYAPFQVPMDQTPIDFSPYKFPMQDTPAEFSQIQMPVEATGAEYTAVALPVKPTPPVPVWTDVPIDD